MLDMDRGVRGWIINTTKLNYWRVAGFYEFDDLVQDGYLHYHRVIAKYSNVKQPAQLMALFKTCFTNHIHDIAKQRTKREHDNIDSTARVSIDQASHYLWQHPDTNENLATMPLSLRSLIRALQSDPRVRKPCRRWLDHRETTNEKLCRIVGADPRSINLLEKLRELLSTDTTVLA